MPYRGGLYARAVRRATMILPKLSRANGTDPFPSEDERCTCPYCGKRLQSEGGRNRHIILRTYCRARHLRTVSAKESLKRKRRPETYEPLSEAAENMPLMKRVRFDDEEPPVAGPSRLPAPNPNPTTPTIELADLGTGNARAATGLFVEPFPVSTAGAPIGTKRRNEQDLREYLELCGRLGDRDLFETAEILMTTGLSGRGKTRHLKGPMYKWKGKGVWKNNEELLRDIDQLPKGPTWTTAEVSAGEDEYERTHTVYLRDILEVIRQLIGARRFKRWMQYAPERHWTSHDQKCRVYDEMWSGDWWWRMQYLIRDENGTVVPLIVATDETTLTNNANGPKAHPVYLSIGNISKSIRRKPTKRAMVVVGYLPVDSFEDVTNEETRRRYRGELLHRSLAKIFEPLKTASEEGILTWCADGYLRHIYPILAVWLADWPEQNDIACTTQSGCPRCKKPRKGRGQGGPVAPARDQDDMLKAFRAYEEDGRSKVLEPLCLTPWSPFWAEMPHFDIASCFAPDLLHQLYKGMFEHARNWVERLLGTKELNRRFKSMPLAQDLRWFKKGVTAVKVWAGRESREMMQQFLPVIIDAQAPADFVVLIRALLDFSYIAHGAQLTDVELAEMDKALATFHRVKRVLVDEKIMSALGSFDRIAELHMVGHWTGDIRELGTPDGFSTETPEHLHIVYVKVPWRMSNRRNPMPQIVTYVRRLEAVQIQRAYIEEFYGEDPGFDLEDFERHANDDDEESEDEGSIVEDECSIAGDSDNEDEQVEVGSEPDLEPEQGKSEMIHYPRPKISLAQRPTVCNVPGHVLITSYGMTGLLRALRAFIATRSADPLDPKYLVLPSNHFDVWHKATLNHLPLPFSPSEPCHRDIVRIHPAVRDDHSCVKPGVFDTGLFAMNADGFGLARFRAGRVRGIFTLPSHLQRLYSGPLVYLDVYTPFVPDLTTPRCLYRTTPAYFNGGYASLVVPLSCLAMACHMVPDFSLPPTRTRPFLFNDYYNHFTFLVTAYWQRMSIGGVDRSS